MYTCSVFDYPAGCGDPDPPGNGSVIEFVSAAVGLQVLYSCDQGFLPVEVMNSTCASDMNWSPNPAEFTCRELGNRANHVSTHNKLITLLYSPQLCVISTF